ncbi:hypothetical protein [Roseivirga sp. E12]|uniref:hypothetical protein n=1 Tax=Roseivirga sp. E12 TaxID=2819237 RepID=UPI001ABC8D19|nr:hypothetical protein [Roseivirga sp. E12]MBO3700700.1 hypothetical protein [Roseivirga sp. E12]
MRVILTLLLLCSFTLVQAQSNKKTEADSVVFFYASMKMRSGLNVVSPIDSVSLPKKGIKQELFKLNANNRLRFVKFAQKELGDPTLSAKINNRTNILEANGDLRQLKSDLDKYLSQNKGNVYNLLNYVFAKPNAEKALKKETRYE